MKPMREQMRRHHGPVDACIVGSGAGGATLAKELAEGGMSVVVIEAGPWLDTVEDFVNDELSSLDGRLDWDDLRISDGNKPMRLGRQTTGRAVGGSTVHFTAVKLRLWPEDFTLRTRFGISDDWPISYEDLEPYYTKAERFVGVSGPRRAIWPASGAPYPFGELPMNAGDEVIASGMEKLGIKWCMTPHAIITGPHQGRSPCMFYGYCIQGCKSDAKGSALVTWVPAAVKAGAEIRENCFATRIETDSQGKATGVVYLHEGKEHRQDASLIFVCCYSVETPRLLLNSATSKFPDGLCNSSGLVGKYLMCHPGAEVYGRFSQPLDNFVSPPVGIMSQDHYSHGAGGRYDRGFMLQRYAFFPIDFAANLVSENKEMWGKRLLEIMDTYPCWTICSSQGEMLPREENQVTIADEKDQHGVPVARVTMNYADDDRARLEDGARICKEILEAAGAEETMRTIADYHVLGTCRMGSDPARSVVDSNCRSWDVPNLYIVDGSVFVTEGSVNPSLTIEAIALRTAERVLSGRAAESRKGYVA